MGKVYRAEQAPLGREVALKVLNPNYSGDSDPEFHKRFFLEASTCSKLTHPNTVTIFDYGRTDDDIYYIAMELLEGRTLHRVLRDDGPMSAPRAMHIARQVCRSLREAHGLGVIHRDLKPANIFLVMHGDEKDFVKVLDFGLVKDLDETGEDLTQTGLFMGSPKYMSPEQIRGEKVDARADVYALGVILYEMITGKVPFDRPNSVNILMAHVHEAPPPLKELHPGCDAGPALEAIVMKSLAKNPDERYTTMDEFLVALKETASDQGFSVTRSTDLASQEIAAAGITGQFGASDGQLPAYLTGLSESAPAALPSAPPPSVELGERPTSYRLPLIFAFVGALGLALAGIVALIAASGGDEPEPRPVVALPETTPRENTSTEPITTRPTGTNDTTSPPAVQTAIVALRSTPLGARVLVDDVQIGVTPTEIEWTGADAELGRRVTFLFRLDGHRDYSVTRVITGNRLEITATLEEVAAVPRPGGTQIRRRGGRGPTGRRGDDPVGPVQGYKLDPY
ncbi:MAG: serine/threonine protein kinase [Sandaracinaceae bacterium]|nr:serine/threonine protein kinase [Sandaracinaceae bacterium]